MVQLIFSLMFFSLTACAQPQDLEFWVGRGHRSSTDTTKEYRLSPTVYFLYEVRKDKMTCRAWQIRNFYSASGEKLQSVCQADYQQCLMQGSCDVIENGKVTSLNFQSRRRGSDVWSLYDHRRCPDGMGVAGHCLVPYRTVAADLEHWSVGDVIFVPSVVGLELPDGSVHDGYFTVKDTGSAIKGPHRFDFFIGRSATPRIANFFTSLGFGDKNSNLTYRRAHPSEL